MLQSPQLVACPSGRSLGSPPFYSALGGGGGGALPPSTTERTSGLSLTTPWPIIFEHSVRYMLDGWLWVAKPVWSPLTKPGRRVWASGVLGALQNEGDMTSLCHPLGHGWQLQGTKVPPFRILLPVLLATPCLEVFYFHLCK